MAKGKYFYNRPRTVNVGIDAVSGGSTTEPVSYTHLTLPTKA